MPRIGASISDIKTVFPPMPEDAYPAQIKDVEHKKSKSGKPMIVLTYEVTDGDFKGRQLFENITLVTDEGERNEAGLRSLKRVIENLLGEDRANDDDFDTDELKGLPCVIFVKQEQRKDDKDIIDNRVKKVLPTG